MALSAALNVPVLVPMAVGWNTTLMVQWLLAARVVAHVVAETLKSAVVEIAMPLRVTLCLLVSVNTFARLVVPTLIAE